MTNNKKEKHAKMAYKQFFILFYKPMDCISLMASVNRSKQNIPDSVMAGDLWELRVGK